MLLRRPLLFAASFLLVFALGLLVGGDRLLTTDQADEVPCAAETEARLPVLFAFLCGQADLQRDRAALSGNEARQSAAQAWAQTAQRTAPPRRDGSWPARDANGNVLQPGRYMQAVYFAFALGDVSG